PASHDTGRGQHLILSRAAVWTRPAASESEVRAAPPSCLHRARKKPKSAIHLPTEPAPRRCRGASAGRAPRRDAALRPQRGAYNATTSVRSKEQNLCQRFSSPCLLTRAHWRKASKNSATFWHEVTLACV